MKIVVLQRDKEVLELVKETVARINPARAEQILFTSEQGEVMRAVADRQPVLVVSGQYLGRDLLSPARGTRLARLVKGMNPNVIFFMFSVEPDTNEFVDGVIPKEWDDLVSEEPLLIARVLTSDLEGATAESIRAAFPEIKREI